MTTKSIVQPNERRLITCTSSHARRGADRHGRKPGGEPEQARLREQRRAEPARRETQRPQHAELARSLELDREQRAQDAEKRDDAGEHAQDFGDLERSVEDGERQLFEPGARAHARRSCRPATNGGFDRRGVRVRGEVDADARQLVVAPIAPIPLERHDDRRLAGIEVAERADDR